MKIKELQEQFSHTRPQQEKAIFAGLLMLANRLHTGFDKGSPALPLKQFMLLIVIRQAGHPQSLTELGALLCCSRQNVKKLGEALVKKGLVTASHRQGDHRTLTYAPAAGLEPFFQREAESHSRSLARLFADYGDEELEQFLHLLMRLYPAAEKL